MFVKYNRAVQILKISGVYWSMRFHFKKFEKSIKVFSSFVEFCTETQLEISVIMWPVFVSVFFFSAEKDSLLSG